MSKRLKSFERPRITTASPSVRRMETEASHCSFLVMAGEAAKSAKKRKRLQGTKSPKAF